ncbi:hypothetical protein [Yersinia phage fHe-Yen9-03]|uniref:Uncharacterized protein n=1 Tax=Yersinia phage fHe-Yen9-03 TaxID=2052743 RepID=A0A2C9CYG2_9CAUD|nr:hypothetical protein [Yersinia phage fHe-Yen9-03]
MANKEVEFKVRKWSETNAKPFDVVLVDHLKNNQHYQPHVEFSTIENAEKHMETLSTLITTNPERINFIRDHWPVDAGIE